MMRSVRFFELQSENLSFSTATIPYKRKPQIMSQAAVRSHNVRVVLFYTSLLSETMACVYTKKRLTPKDEPLVYRYLKITSR